MKYLALVALTLTVLASPLTGQNKQPCSQMQEAHWMAKMLTEIATIHVGMTRADLLRVFTPAGGFGTGKTFLYRGLSYIMVDVEFASHTDTNKRVDDLQPTDVITSISRPYLEFPHYD